MERKTLTKRFYFVSYQSIEFQGRLYDFKKLPSPLYKKGTKKKVNFIILFSYATMALREIMRVKTDLK